MDVPARGHMLAPKSLTHAHIFNCVNSVVPQCAERTTVRILDAGCGNGELISYMHQCFAEIRPNLNVEIYGFDVNDHGVQAQGFLEGAISTLRSASPDVDWSGRIHSIGVEDEWPFESGFFDFVVSNQVLEHVPNKRRFFRNVHRCLKVGGYGIALNPLRHCAHEGHIWLPFAHRIRSYDLLYSYIKACSRVGLGKFRSHARTFGVSIEEFSRRHADYMLFWTAYSTQAETLDAARNAGLRGDFRFTREFYSLKLRQVLRIKLPRSYVAARSALADAIAIRLLRYVSSVTLVVQKNNEYALPS